VRHFAHANGYPPAAYLPFFIHFSQQYHLLAMRMRPLWPSSDPKEFSDWRALSKDLDEFLLQQDLNQVIGVGHSMGATTTLRLALQRPDLFRALILIDPVIFRPSTIYTWNLVFKLGLSYRLNPLVKRALRRQTNFANPDVMFQTYRTKTIFSRMNDESLKAYVTAMACPDGEGQIRLCYPKEWEARIYATAIHADMDIWRSLPGLVPPVLFLRGSHSDTFLESTVHEIQLRLKTARIKTIPDSTHLVVLEKPGQVYNEIIQFLS
jgi:pimeloyl-ACP methyl ester carboxylesterase